MNKKRPAILARRAGRNQRVDASTLTRVSAAMIPFYRVVALNGEFARRWSRAVREADLATLIRMLRKVAPGTRNTGLSTNGIGYFVEFPLSRSTDFYVNATSLIPGTAQFTFNTAAHRAIARAILPLYRHLAGNPVFAGQLARAINRRDTAAVRRLVRCWVPTKRLVVIRIDSVGIMLGFRFPFSRFTWFNEFFSFREG